MQLWQGSPQTLRLLARQALHLDAVAVYFGGLMLWRGVAALYDGATPGAALWAVAGMLPLVALALGLLGLFAWLIARTSVYTLTNERLVMRIGVVLSITFNLPYRRIASVDLRQRSAYSGDIAVSLSGEDRIAYLHLWPHARPWSLRRTQPMLRGLAQPDEVARVLAQALAHCAVHAGPSRCGGTAARARRHRTAAGRTACRRTGRQSRTRRLT